MRLFVLSLAATLGLGVFACGTSSDPIADDLHLGDDDDDASTSPSSSSSSSSSGGSGKSGSGGPTGSSSSTSSSGAAPVTELGDTYDGEATFYSVDVGEQGNCSLPCPNTYLVAALNTADYDGSALCGGCAKVEGPDGEVVVQIWDRCPTCKVHGIDLSQTAFGKISPTSAGRIDVRWTMVRCPWQDPIQYEVFSDRIQIRNHRVPIEGVAIKTTGAFTDLERRNDNFFTGTIPSGTFAVRITGTSGEVLDDTIDGRGPHAGSVQFE